MKKIKLCSACLLGVNCRYSGKSAINEKVVELAKKGGIIPVCPEQLGGLPTPRDACEQKNDRVINKNGKDFTKEFNNGAKEVLKLAKLLGIKEMILKSKSPSCGCGFVYDGYFNGTLISGDGTLTILLKKNGIRVISEDEL